jgi:hypothetical protein
MKMYFNGCSFTYGDELPNPQQSAWPTLVCSELKCDFLNDAVSGGTNDRIMYKTVQNINNYDYFVIAWTNYNRFTEYNPVDNFEINFNPNLHMDPARHHSNDLKKNYSKYKDYGQIYYKYWYNDLFEFKKWLQQIILLQSFFKQHNKSFLMLNTSNNNLPLWLKPQEKFIDSTKHLIDFFDYANDDQLLEEHTQIQKYNSMIDTSTFIEWANWSITDLSTTHECGPGGHILEEGHQAVANKVIDCYNTTT